MEKKILNTFWINKKKYLLGLGCLNLIYTYISIFIVQIYGFDLSIYLEEGIKLSSVILNIVEYLHITLLFISLWLIYYCLFDFLDKYYNSKYKVLSIIMLAFVILILSIPLIIYYIFKMKK